MSELNERGEEIFDQTPVECPIHFERPMPLHLRIRQQILMAMSDLSQIEEYDTPEEANDFSMDEDDGMSSPYQMEDDFDHISNEIKNAVQKDSPSEQVKTGAEPSKDADLSGGPASASDAG